MKDLFSPDRCERFIEAITYRCPTCGSTDPAADHSHPKFRGADAVDVKLVANPEDVLAAVDSVGITGHDFVELDERPAQFDSRYRDHGWHAALRRVRNDPANDLFERLSANNQRTSA